MDLVTQQLHERRERILAAARELIGEVGFQGLTMRDLAARCRVSVPTLYNQFGSKNELLAAAVQSHFSGLLGSLPHGTPPQGQARVVAVVKLCAAEMTRLPEYHRSLIQAFMEVRETDTTQDTLTRNLARELTAALEEMCGRKQLAPWVDAGVLAEHLTVACVASATAWAFGALDDAALEASMLYACCSLVLASAKGAARTALQAEATAAQQILVAKRSERVAAAALPASAVEA